MPQANQLLFGGSYGSTNRKGWNAAALVDYDLLLNRRLFYVATVSYNTDCCGFAFQLRRFNSASKRESVFSLVCSCEYRELRQPTKAGTSISS